MPALSLGSGITLQVSPLMMSQVVMARVEVLLFCAAKHSSFKEFCETAAGNVEYQRRAAVLAQHFSPSRLSQVVKALRVKLATVSSLLCWGLNLARFRLLIKITPRNLSE